MKQPKNQDGTSKSVRVPEDLGDLLTKLADHFEMSRDKLVAELLRQDIGHLTETVEILQRAKAKLDDWRESRKQAEGNASKNNHE